MKIFYEDEYGVELFNIDNSIPPDVGDIIVLNGNDWYIKSRVFYLDNHCILVVLTQNTPKSEKTVDTSSGRFYEMNRAIVALNKRQDINEKKNRMLAEQIVTVRQHINNRIQQERKET